MTSSQKTIPGIRWYENIKAWRADIGFQKNRMQLGNFKKKSDAIKIRKKAEKLLIKLEGSPSDVKMEALKELRDQFKPHTINGVLPEVIIGQTYNEWTVIKEAKPGVQIVKQSNKEYRYPQRRYACVCSCGNKGVVIGRNLLNGISKTCGKGPVHR